MKRILSIPFLLLPFLVMGQEEGFHMVNEAKHFNGSDPKTETSTIQLTDTKLRTDVEGEGTSVIFKEEEQVMYVLDHEEQTYLKITEEDIERMEAQMERAREQLEDMPEEQRKQMEEMMGDRLSSKEGPEIRYQKTGEKEEVEKWGSCEEFEGKDEEERLHHKVHTVPFEKVELPEERFEVFHSLMEFMTFIPGDLEERIPMEPEKMEENGLEGFGVKWAHYNKNGRKTREHVYKEIGKKELDPSVFEIPEDYVEEEMPQGQPGQGGR